MKRYKLFDIKIKKLEDPFVHITIKNYWKNLTSTTISFAPTITLLKQQESKSFTLEWFGFVLIITKPKKKLKTN